MKNKQVVWIMLWGPIMALLLLGWLVPDFTEKNWFIPLSLSAASFMALLKLGGYKGISTVISIVVTSFALIVTWWLWPKGLISGAIILILWIVIPVVIWWDLDQPPR